MNIPVALKIIIFISFFDITVLYFGLQRKDSYLVSTIQHTTYLLPCLISAFIQLTDCDELYAATQWDEDSGTGLDQKYAKTYHSFHDVHDVFYLMDEQMITIASKREEKASNAPSIVTVITADEIENLGIRTLTEALRFVPGFDILKSAAGGANNISVRGISTADFSNEKIRILLDGHYITWHFSGNTSMFFDDLPLKNVKRIEIIRGPGSALYGANAFLAVINIITKESSDINGVEMSTGFGSYDTQEYNIMVGKEFRDIQIAGFLSFYNTNGLSDTIKEDLLSSIQIFNRFSTTPGDTDDGRKKFDMYLKASYKDLELNAKYMNKDTEPFVNTSGLPILTNGTEQEMNYVMADLKYKLEVGDKLTIKPRVYYDQNDWDVDVQFSPEGFILPIFIDGKEVFAEFPDGQLGHEEFTNRNLGGEIQIDYNLFNSNAFTFGFKYDWIKQTNISVKSNFDPISGLAFRSILDFTDLGIIPKITRQIWAVYFQDKWDITEKLGLTIGARHDNYSDFGGTTNPRIGLVWNFMDNAVLKLLYGQAFRAPDFGELFLNKQFKSGSVNLDPETIRTYEIGFGYKFTDDIDANVNYFFNVMRDVIDSDARPNGANIIDNIGSANVQGIEFEVKANFPNLFDGVYVFANYTYLDAESKGDPLPDVPKHKGNIGINVKPCKYLNVNLDAFISDKRVRSEKDRRDDSPGYTIVNLTLIAKEFFKDFKLKASLFNLLDKDYNDPAPINTIPTDLPRPGRTFFLEFGYEF